MDIPQLVDVRAVGRVGRYAAVRVARMSDHRAHGVEVDRVHSAVIVRTRIGQHEARTDVLGGHSRPARQQPLHGPLVRLADAGLGAAFGRHVAQRRPLVHRQTRQPRTTELDRAVERLLVTRILPQDVQHDVLGSAAEVQLSSEFEADGLGNVHEGEAVVDQVGELCRAHPVGESIGSPTHAGV